MSLTAPEPRGAGRGAGAASNPYPDDPAFLTYESRVICGTKRPLNPANPAAGAQWSVQVPGGRQWRVLSARAQLGTSGAVQNRNVGVQITVAGVTICQYVASDVQTAGNAFSWSWFPASGTPGQGGAGPGGAITIPLMWLPPGSVFASFATGFDVNDVWQSVGVYIEEALFDDTLLTDTIQNALETP